MAAAAAAHTDSSSLSLFHFSVCNLFFYGVIITTHYICSFSFFALAKATVARNLTAAFTNSCSAFIVICSTGCETVRMHCLTASWCVELIHFSHAHVALVSRGEPGAAMVATAAISNRNLFLQRNQFKIPDEYNDQTSSAFFASAVSLPLFLSLSHSCRLDSMHTSVDSRMHQARCIKMNQKKAHGSNANISNNVRDRRATASHC